MTPGKRGGNSSLDMLGSVISTEMAPGILVDVVGGMLTGGILKK